MRNRDITVAGVLVLTGVGVWLYGGRRAEPIAKPQDPSAQVIPSAPASAWASPGTRPSESASPVGTNSIGKAIFLLLRDADGPDVPAGFPGPRPTKPFVCPSSNPEPEAPPLNRASRLEDGAFQLRFGAAPPTTGLATFKFEGTTYFDIVDVPATQPATKPAPATTRASKDAAALVRQLGDDKAKARNEAMAALKKMGREALPALKAAVNDEDPQVRTSVAALIGEIEHPRPAVAARPGANGDDGAFGPGIIRGPGGGIIRLGPGGALRINGGVRMSVSVSNVNGVITRDVQATENGGRQVRVHDGPDGVSVDVTENGETKSYKAATAAELKEKEPEGYAVYEKYAQAGGVR